MNKLLIKQSLTILKNNPMKILNIFNIKKLYKFGLNILFNQVTNFQNLPKTRQINILNNSYSTLKKINDKITKKKNIFDKKFEDLKKENLNNSNYIEFANLFDKHGSDKHKSNLTHLYFQLILKNKIEFIAEIGMGTNNIKIISNMGLGGKPGASLRAFSEYLPDNKIFGADIDRDILFQEKNIQTFFIDQLDVQSIINFKNKIPTMDLIIDDGLHLPDANLNIVNNLIDKLNAGGFLVVEDVEDIFCNIFQILAFNLNTSEKYIAEFIQDEKNNFLVIKKNF
jgi:hypothetical protein